MYTAKWAVKFKIVIVYYVLTLVEFYLLLHSFLIDVCGKLVGQSSFMIPVKLCIGCPVATIIIHWSYSPVNTTACQWTADLTSMCPLR